MKNLLFLSLLCLASIALAQNKNAYKHLTFSQVGYDIDYPKHAMLRSEDAAMFSEKMSFELRRVDNDKRVFKGQVQPSQEKWGKYWWTLDFSKYNKEGAYYVVVKDGKDDLVVGDKSFPLKIGEEQLWNESWYATALSHLHIRDKESYQPEGGWRDCGSPLQELSSHVIMLNALCDLLIEAPGYLSEKEKSEIYYHLVIGADYVCNCQDMAYEIGYQKGAVVHEMRQNLKVVTGNVAKTAMILARISRLIKEENSEKSAEYLSRSLDSYAWLEKHGPVEHWGYGPEFEWTHGAPQKMKRAPKEYMTRDLVMMMWASLEFYQCGKKEYKTKAIDYASRIMARQVPQEKAEEGLYGHFYTYDSYDFTEKANIHCGAWQQNYKVYNQGGHFPHYLIPMVEMIELWNEHQDAEKWEQCVHDFAYGYFVPATNRNPFKILPAGYYQGQGLLNFSGWYHGHNKIFGYAAALAYEFYNKYDDPQFVEIAVGNLQWIAGLHSGFPGDDKESSASMIVGIGNVSKADWDAMTGTITNGFESDGQFKLTKPTLANDKPVVFGDEGGIHHPAGWISGLSRWTGYVSEK